MEDIFQSNIENIFINLKRDKETPVPSKMETILPSGEKLEVYVITKSLSDEDLVIKLLARWRDKANVWFPAQFKVTLKGTKKWASEQLINKKDRILFFFKVKDEKLPFAHAGLYRFDYEKQSCEIDNVIRGEESKNTKGAMTVGLETLIKWSFTYLGIKDLYLRVFSDNTRAIKLYERLGFSEKNRVPLFKSISNEVVSWVESDSRKESTDRYFVTMRYGKKAEKNSKEC